MIVRKSISLKIALISVGFTLLSSIIFSTLHTYLDYERAKLNYESSIDQLIKSTELSLARSVHTLDKALGKEILTGLSAHKFIQELRLTDERGQPIAGIINSFDHPQSMARYLAKKFFPRWKFYSFPLPPMVQDSPYTGTLKLVINYPLVMEDFVQRAFNSLISNLFKSLLLMIVIMVIVYRTITKPLERLNEKIKQVKSYTPGKPEFSLDSDNRADEIGVIGATIKNYVEQVSELQQARDKSENALKEAFDNLNVILDHLPHAVYLRSKSGDFLFHNQQMTALLAEDSTLWQPTVEQESQLFDLDFDVFQLDENRFIPELVWQNKDGRSRFFEVRKDLINFLSEKAIICVATDITERKRYAARVKHMAFHDSLTDLPNRALLQDRLEQAIIMSERNGQLGALLFIDLDNFKKINDTLGHRAGDVLLKTLADRLSKQTRASDTVARIGGDEFVIVLLNLDSDTAKALELANLKAQQIREECFQPACFEGSKMLVSASIGITLFPELNFSASDLLRNADTAMYLAKARGKDTQLVFEKSMAHAFHRQLQLEADLKQALENEEFFLTFQIQVDEFGRITGAEVLSRWQHPDEGLISPVEFIPVLESTGMITRLDEWVIRSCCKKIAQWRADGLWHDHMFLGINISPQQFRQSNFLELLKHAIEDNGIPPTMIDLEITEGMIIEQIDETIERMSEIREFGVSFSIDDFGTGYSSLAYLKQLPLDYLKVDQSFIRDVNNDKNDAAIVETILAMSRHLGLKTIAEGVETREQLDFLLSQGCNKFQGYYFSKPLPEDEFIKLILSYDTINLH